MANKTSLSTRIKKDNSIRVVEKKRTRDNSGIGNCLISPHR